MGVEEADAQVIAAEVRSYVAGHPQASDTAEGVRLWWLAPRSAVPSLSVVACALDALVALGELVQRTLGDGTVLYSAAPGGQTAVRVAATAVAPTGEERTR